MGEKRKPCSAFLSEGRVLVRRSITVGVLLSMSTSPVPFLWCSYSGHISMGGMISTKRVPTAPHDGGCTPPPLESDLQKFSAVGIPFLSALGSPL